MEEDMGSCHYDILGVDFLSIDIFGTDTTGRHHSHTLYHSLHCSLPVISSSLSARVLLPWSTWATMLKFLILSGGKWPTTQSCKDMSLGGKRCTVTIVVPLPKSCKQTCTYIMVLSVGQFYGTPYPRSCFPADGATFVE